MNFYDLLAKHRDRVKGGLADKKSPFDFDIDQLYKGYKVELEHTKNPQLALEIAMDHLTENPKCYDALAKIEAKERKRKVKVKLGPFYGKGDGKSGATMPPFKSPPGVSLTQPPGMGPA